MPYIIWKNVPNNIRNISVSGTQNLERNVPNTAHTNVPTNSVLLGTLFLLALPVPTTRVSTIKNKSLIDLKWLASSGAEDCTHCQFPPPKALSVAVCTRGQTCHKNQYGRRCLYTYQTLHEFKPYCT
jgi:hypothetical protein